MRRTNGRQRGRVLQRCLDSKGYPIFQMCIPGHSPRTVKVHRMVAAAFIGPASEGMQVNHKNGDKSDNAASNLEYVTCKENIRHCWESGLHSVAHSQGEANSLSKLTVANVLEIRNGYPGKSIGELARKFGVTRQSVYGVIRRRTWKHL